VPRQLPLRAVKNTLLHAPPPVRDGVGLALFRGYELYTSLRPGRTRIVEDNGLPVPPARLRTTVVGYAEPEPFLATGHAENAMIRDALARAERPIESLDSLLDWGCGCGRLTRWLADIDADVYACDYNGDLVGWVSRNLPFVTATRNDLAPPLPYGDSVFDFVYALSVFTHLRDDSARAWLAEIKRVLRPDGLFFFTTHGSGYRYHLSPGDAVRFNAGHSVVQFGSVEGTNLCAAYHPRRWMEGAATDAGLVVVEVIEAADVPESERVIGQDRYLVGRG